MSLFLISVVLGIMCLPFLFTISSFCRFSLKDKCKLNKKFFPSENGSSPQSDNNVSSTSITNGSKTEMRTSMPIIKVMNKNDKKSRYESSQIKTWTVRDVAQFIRSIGLVEHALHFEEQVSSNIFTKFFNAQTF